MDSQLVLAHLYGFHNLKQEKYGITKFYNTFQISLLQLCFVRFVFQAKLELILIEACEYKIIFPAPFRPHVSGVLTTFHLTLYPTYNI